MSSIKNNHRLSSPLLFARIADISHHNAKTEDLTNRSKQIIRELRTRNKEILPENLHQVRFTLLGLACLISLVGGVVLTLAGIGFCCTGAALPLGITLLGSGMGLLILGVPLSKYCLKKIKQENEVHDNIEKITVLKKIIKEPRFKEYLLEFSREMNLTEFPLPDLALNYDLVALYNSNQIYREETEKKPKKHDPQSLRYWDYTAYFNFVGNKTSLANKFLNEINQKIGHLNEEINQETKRVSNLKQEKQILLERAREIKEARSHFLDEAPQIGDMSPAAFSRFEAIQRATKRSFSALS